MAKTLPFVVQPRRKPVKVRIGSEDCGILEIEARGHLTVAEKFYVSQIVNGDKTVSLMIGLSNKIAKRLKKDQKDGYTILTDYLQNRSSVAHRDIIDEEFGDEIQELTGEITRISSLRELAQATIMMRSRIDPDWSTDDTLELDTELIEALVKLYNEEERKEFPETEDKEITVDDEYEAAVGKLPDQTPEA